MTTRSKVSSRNGPRLALATAHNGRWRGVRERQLNIRLNDEEMEWLMNVAKHYGLNGSSVLRMLLKREHDALQGDRPPMRGGP
jgi:hypothetical protein